MKRNRWSVLGILAALTLVALVAPVGVSARKVANSGPFRMDITSSYVHINDGFELSRDPRRSPECSDGADNDQNGVADSMDPKCVSGPAGQPASDDDDEFAPGFQPADATFLEGQIDDNGQVTIPSTGVHFKPMRRMFVNPLGGPSAVIRADIVGAGVSTGSLDPISGDAELEMKLRVRLSGDIWGNPLPESCSIGSERDPITVRLTSGLTPPTQRFAVSGGNPLTGPYVSLISTQFSVPAASGCLLGGWLDISSTISDSQYLPAPGGTSMFRIDGRIAPAPVPGVVAKVEPVIQDNVSGVVPFDVAFAGSGSTVANGPATYEWDFGDGTTSTEANPMHTFKAPGPTLLF